MTGISRSFFYDCWIYINSFKEKQMFSRYKFPMRAFRLCGFMICGLLAEVAPQSSHQRRLAMMKATIREGIKTKSSMSGDGPVRILGKSIARCSGPKDLTGLKALRMCLGATKATYGSDSGELIESISSIQIEYELFNFRKSPRHPIGRLLEKESKKWSRADLKRKAALRATQEVSLEQMAPGLLTVLRDLEERTSGKLKFFDHGLSEVGYLSTYDTKDGGIVFITTLNSSLQDQQRGDVMGLRLTPSSIECVSCRERLWAFDLPQLVISPYILFKGTGDNRVQAIQEYLAAEAFKQGLLMPEGYPSVKGLERTMPAPVPD
jgi:hypothetical protein